MLKAVTYSSKAWEHHGISGIYHVAHPVAYPIGVTHGERHGIGAGSVVAFGAFRRAAVDWRIGYHVAIVVAEPQDSTNLAWQPATHLADVGETCLLGTCRTLVEILLAIDSERQWRWTVRHLPYSSTHISRVESQGSILVMIAHVGLQVFDTQLAIGDNPQGHVLGVLVNAKCPREVAAHVLVVVEE